MAVSMSLVEFAPWEHSRSRKDVSFSYCAFPSVTLFLYVEQPMPVGEETW